MPIHIRYGNGPSNARFSNCLRPASSFESIRLIVDAEKPWPQSASFTFETFRVETPCAYIYVNAETFATAKPAGRFTNARRARTTRC